MRTDFTALNETVIASPAKIPVTLMLLQWPAQPLGVPALTLRLCDKAGINIEGTVWYHLMESSGALEQLVDSAMAESGANGSANIAVINHPTDLFSPAKPFSYIFRQYRPEAGLVTLYQWYEDEGMTSADLTPLFVGRPTDPISFDENICSFNVVDVATDYGEQKFGSLINATDYPLAPESSMGKMKPIVFGTVPNAPAIPLRATQETRVKSVVQPGGSLINVADASSFPASGTILINDDEIAYTSKNATQFLGCTGINEFHYADDVVLEKVTGHRYLLSDPAYPIESIGAVKAGGHLVDAGDYSVDLANGEVVFPDKPKKTDSIDTKFLQAQMDAVASANNATDPGNAFIPNSPATYAKLNQSATPLALKQTDDLPNVGEIASVLVRVEHFMEEKLSSDSLTVEIPGIGSLGTLPPPAVDDLAVVTGDVDITHDTLIGSLAFPINPSGGGAGHAHTTAGSPGTENQNDATSASPPYIKSKTLPAFTTSVTDTITLNFPALVGTNPTGYTYTLDLLGTISQGLGTLRVYAYLEGVLIYDKNGGTEVVNLTSLAKSGTPSASVDITVHYSYPVESFSGSGSFRLESQVTRTVDLAGATTTDSQLDALDTEQTGALETTTGTPALNTTSEKATKTVVKHFDITSYVTGWDWFKDKEIHVLYNGTSDGRTAFIIHTAFEIEYARRRVSFTDEISADVNGVIDDASGSVTGTPSALIERPDHLYKWSVLMGLSKSTDEIDSVSFTNAGSFYATQAGGYKLAGIVQNQTAWRDLWREWGRSCRSSFYWDLGKAKTMIRPINRVALATTYDKEIDPDDLRLDGDKRLIFKTERGASRNIVNAIDLKYQKDWSGGESEPYSAIESVSDANSILRYDRREDASRFQFDWVRESAMAGDLAEFYLEEFAEPLDVYTFELFLPYMALERGDIIRLCPPSHDLDNVLCVVLGAGRVFGSGKEGRMDSISITARVMRGWYAGPGGFGLTAFGACGFGGIEKI